MAATPRLDMWQSPQQTAERNSCHWSHEARGKCDILLLFYFEQELLCLSLSTLLLGAVIIRIGQDGEERRGQRKVFLMTSIQPGERMGRLVTGMGERDIGLNWDRWQGREMEAAAVQWRPQQALKMLDRRKASTLLQKWKVVRFWFPATIPVPYEPPGSGLSGNIKF